MATQTQHYHPVAKILHWWIAGMIVLQFILAKLAERADDAGAPLKQLALLANHKSVGITILLLAVIRIIWRRLHPPPAPLPMPRWQTLASRLSHWTLYTLLFLMPVSGWLMSSASAYSVSWFNLVQLPDLVGANPELKELFESVHETLAKVLFVVAAVHIAAGLKHAFVNRDGALRRISSPISIGIFAVVIAGGYWTLSNVGVSPARAAAIDVTAGAVDASAQTVTATADRSGDIALWDIDYPNSYIRFTGDQAGATFSGEWQQWTAELRFDPDRPAAGSFDVTVEVRSVASGDKDRDDTITDMDWFDASNFPQAFYRATSFSTDSAGRFVAHGSIVIKNAAYPAELQFSVSDNDGRYVLDGNARLDRTALNLGLGEWADTDWVGQFVDVVVHVEANTVD